MTSKKPPSKAKKKIEPKNIYEEKIKGFIDATEEQITSLKEKGKHLTEDTKVKYEEQLVNLKVQQEKLSKKLTKISEASEENWEDMKEDMHDGFEHIKEETAKAFEGIKSGFKYLLAKVDKTKK